MMPLWPECSAASRVFTICSTACSVLAWISTGARNVTLGQGGVVLDLAAGTLDVALAVRRRHPTALVPALDFCPPMLSLGRRKLKGDNARRVLPVAAAA